MLQYIDWLEFDVITLVAAGAGAAVVNVIIANVAAQQLLPDVLRAAAAAYSRHKFGQCLVELLLLLLRLQVPGGGVGIGAGAGAGAAEDHRLQSSESCYFLMFSTIKQLQEINRVIRKEC
ncbi:conserved hypothetical protein [Ricinus communis]|uniref:Uncharacterized protein n=1 Tax=Ricinus communis TaxID=3988 RepID=B9TBZ8_RICCO|nr:conserved hypothetical protein [Ricinus communis]